MSFVAATMGSTRRNTFILLFCAVYLGFQVFMIVRGHRASNKHFTFWAAGDSTYFKATLTRVLSDRREVITSDGAWAVQTDSTKTLYDWHRFVFGYGLDRLGKWERTDRPFDNTLNYFQAALDYVAERIPKDRVTQQLVLTIEYERAGLPDKIVLASRPRFSERPNGGSGS